MLKIPKRFNQQNLDCRKLQENLVLLTNALQKGGIRHLQIKRFNIKAKRFICQRVADVNKLQKKKTIKGV